MIAALPMLAVFAICLPTVAAAQTALDLLFAPADLPMLSYTTIGRMNAVSRADVMAIEVSEQGGLTDIFIRLSPPATERLAEWTTLATGFPMTVSVCGAPVREGEIETPVTSGTIYIPNLNAIQAEALRAVWHGRATCSTLSPEVFPIGQ